MNFNDSTATSVGNAVIKILQWENLNTRTVVFILLL